MLQDLRGQTRTQQLIIRPVSIPGFPRQHVLSALCETCVASYLAGGEAQTMVAILGFKMSSARVVIDFRHDSVTKSWDQ